MCCVVPILLDCGQLSLDLVQLLLVLGELGLLLLLLLLLLLCPLAVLGEARLQEVALLARVS